MAGTDTMFAIGTNLEIWPCQSLINKPFLGYYDENVKALLEKSEDNRRYYNREILPECPRCPILNWCRGGCRATYDNPAVAKITCRTKKEVMDFIFTEIKDYHPKSNSLNDIMNNFIKNNTSLQFVETPPLPE
jgi:radical SAM protein with 4Fe4S-binding SPASM domain